MTLKNGNKIKKTEIVLLIFLLIFAFFLRIYSLGTPPLWIDESISAVAAESILEEGALSFESGEPYSAYVLHYLFASALVFSKTDFAVRIFSVIFGLLTILLAYFIGRDYSKSGGIIASLFMTVFYLEVFFSRQSRYYQLFQLAFFASLYFLYKSKDKPIFLIPGLISFFIAIDTHLTGLILAPFFIFHILIYSKKYWFVSVLPIIPLVTKFITVIGLSSGSSGVINAVGNYFAYTNNMLYLLLLFIPGLIGGFIKDKRLTLLILLPSVITLIGIFSLKLFAFRYVYFFVFPLLLYSSLLFSFLYDKYGKLVLLPLFLVIIIPSNLFFPQAYVNVITPVDYNFNDYSAPETNFKAIPSSVLADLKSETILVSYFSPNVEWYIRKPDFVVPFSLNGIGEDQVSTFKEGKQVDLYSGAPILKEKPTEEYNLIADSFSVSKLKPSQREFFSELTRDCTIMYTNYDLQIYNCPTNLNNQINGESL